MKTINIFIYIFLLIINIFHSNEKHLVFPFTTSYKNTLPEGKIFQNDLEVKLGVGTPSQNLGLYLRMQYYTFFVTSSEVQISYDTFDASKSTSIQYDDKTPRYNEGQEYRYSLKIYDMVNIQGNEKKNMSLILATQLLHHESGALGLKLVDTHEFNDDMSFIYQIKKLLNLDTYAFVLNYTDEQNGELIIGAYPHLYSNLYQQKDFCFTKAGKINNIIDWVLDFDLIRYDNVSIQNIVTKSLIQIEFKYIRAPLRLKQYFNDKFFHDKCEEKNYYIRNVTVLYCNKNKVDITQFKKLSFILKDIDQEFVLTYKELFIDNGDQYMFGIAFDRDTRRKDPTWILGKIFMKKFNLVYDLDKKIIGLYRKVGIYNEKIEEEEKSSGYKVYVIFIVILVVVVLGLMGFIIYFFKHKKNRKAIELDDDENNSFVYPTKE